MVLDKITKKTADTFTGQVIENVKEKTERTMEDYIPIVVGTAFITVGAMCIFKRPVIHIHVHLPRYIK